MHPKTDRPVQMKNNINGSKSEYLMMVDFIFDMN
jgi:hypothetical protein